MRVTEGAALPQPGDVVGGKYRIVQAIGAGGMGAVYAATHEVTGRSLAIKWMRPRLAEDATAHRRLIQEARAAASIRHPNVVDVQDVGEEREQAFLVMERLYGETLRQLLRREGRLALQTCLAHLVPAMHGVAAAHAQGVIHRDIKPDNIFLARPSAGGQGATPKVLDFGISKVAADTPGAEGTLTVTGAVLGTPHYMSLEQLQAEGVDPRSDIYAFGVVLYECLTGCRPFESENFSAIVVKVATQDPPPLAAKCPGLPDGVEQVVRTAMARHAEDRYPDMQALIDALSPYGAATVEGVPVPLAAAAGESAASAGRPADGAQTLTTKLAPQAGTPHASWRGLRFAGAALAVAAVVLMWQSVAVTPAEGPAVSRRAQPPTPTPGVIPRADAPPPGPLEEQAAPAVTTPSTKGTDTPSEVRSVRARRFGTGWVYLGVHDRDGWHARYFDGWAGVLPRVGEKITARGRSHVRVAMPDSVGDLARAATTVGPTDTIEVMAVARWDGGPYVWARVAPAW